MRIATDPPDAVVSIGGQVLGSREVQLRAAQKYDVVIARLGYESQTMRQISASSNWHFILRPLPVHIRVFTTEQHGKLLLDAQPIGSLQGGDLPDYEFNRDGRDHLLVLKNDQGEVFTVRFQAPTDQAPRVSSISDKELLVVSSLGSIATIYTGSSPTTASLETDRAVPIPPAGLTLTGISAHRNRVNITGAKRRTIAIDPSAAPVLFIHFRGKPDIGYLALKTEIPGATLFLDGISVPARQPGRWVIGRPPGMYSILVRADGFQDRLETVTIAKDAYKSHTVEMTPRPNLCTLRLNGATPGATVLIDHDQAGSVGDAGYWQSDTITAGTHTLELRKPNHDSITRELRCTEPGTNITFEGSAVKLVEHGMLDFRVSQPLAQIRYRRVDERDDHAAAPIGGIRVTPGKYEVRVSGPGLEPITRIYDVTAGQTVRVALALDMVVIRPAAPVAPPPSRVILFENPDVLEHDGEWLHLKEGQAASLKTAAADLNFVLVRPAKGFLKSRKMELSVRCKNGQTVTYEFENRKLTRRTLINGKVNVFVSPFQSASADAPVSVILHLRSGRISLGNGDDAQIDVVDSPGSDFATAKVAIKGDSLFVVRPQ